ncbi:glycosyltransferase family 4 protein [Poseidonocella sp. HB161398]|uniref:glycosyltransferase family 4 protein n=1 Tax=Poseidonocella sp. HB161398 TaxID=2320855 RepID=UPI001487203B|nr:glycosyltransferase family 4 protein [Poseidonocella sp. HB161398]
MARGVERKGWRVAINAFHEIRGRNPGTPMHLLLVGNGPKTDEASTIVHEEDSPHITFLGYQSLVNGIYRISDCAILPTRYPGESNPLCLIQAAQEGLPMISSDMGEIPNMLTIDSRIGGIIVPVERGTEAFTEKFAAAMERMLDAGTRRDFAADSAKISEKYSTDVMIDRYLEAYGAAEKHHDGLLGKSGRAVFGKGQE